MYAAPKRAMEIFKKKVMSCYSGWKQWKKQMEKHDMSRGWVLEAHCVISIPLAHLFDSSPSTAGDSGRWQTNAPAFGIALEGERAAAADWPLRWFPLLIVA
jgi:hypothetical protein